MISQQSTPIKTMLLSFIVCQFTVSIATSQDLSKPQQPTIELLTELPEAAALTPAPTSIESSISAQPVPKVFRPQSDTLSGSDPHPGAARPDYLETVPGMDSGVKITRISQNLDFGVHSYSKRQAWNADETKIDISRKILDVENNYKVLETHPLSGERNWSNINPNVLYGLSRNPTKLNTFSKYNISTGKVTHLREFIVYESCTIGDYEGSLSVDDNYVLLACKNSNGKKELVSYDIANNEVLGKISAASDFNWGSFAQSGKYIIVENNAPGQNKKRELVRYDKNLENKKVILDTSEHGDLGLDDNGDDVYVFMAWDIISYVRLRDGALTELSITNRAGNGHVSCRAIKRPGWCYISTRNQHQRIAAVKISEKDSVVEVWGFSKSSSHNYDAQPKASVSPSGRKIIFSSDWWKNLNQNTPHPGGGGNPNEYVLELTD